MNIVLLSGGSGKRLWSLSNDVRSKLGEDDEGSDGEVPFGAREDADFLRRAQDRKDPRLLERSRRASEERCDQVPASRQLLPCDPSFRNGAEAEALRFGDGEGPRGCRGGREEDRFGIRVADEVNILVHIFVE
jgi:hypothetical protein